MMDASTRNRLRDLARQLDEMIHSPKQRELKERLKRINRLEVCRPPVAVFLPPPADRKLFLPKEQLKVEDPLYAWLEETLLFRLNYERVMPSDVPTTECIHTGTFFSVSDWMEGHKPVRVNPDGTGTAFEPCIVDYSDIKKMTPPQLMVDHKATDEQFERIRDLLGDILPVKKGHPYSSAYGWGDSMIDQLIEMRGLEQFYYDIMDEPGFIHELMRLMTDGQLALMEQFKEHGMLVENNDCLIGSCSFSATSELPGAYGADGRASFENLWGYAQAQELTGVSADTLAEFVLPYQAEVVNRFGLLSYGCCEPIDKDVELYGRFFPKLRILSISPFSNVELAAEKCRGRYVMACKMHPTLAANYDRERTLAYLRRLVTAIKGCSATINFAEIINYGGDEQVFLRLAQDANQVLDELWEA